MSLDFKVFSRAEAIDKALWNEFAADACPMMEWEYFHALEKSGSVSPETGYKPCHLVVYSDGDPVALAPLYERDRAWVEFGDAGLLEFLTGLTGLPYHVGVVGTLPLTPVPGYQFLHHPGLDPLRAYGTLLDQIDLLCESRGLTTSRIYFLASMAPHVRALLSQKGYLILKSSYLVWFNRNYQGFEDYLQSFKSNRRTKIKRELRVIRDLGIDIRMVQGNEVPVDYYRDMYLLHLRTWRKHMGYELRPFLNESFFQLLAETFDHRCSFSEASRSEDRIAMALFYQKSGNLYGRYWGCLEEVPFLHFSTCYYHPIDYAIREGFKMMDPGFGGEHKVIRGYEAVPVYHYIKFHGEKERRVATTVLEKLRANPALPLESF